MKLTFEQISSKISKLEIEKLAIDTGFQKRKPKKIEIMGFIGGFFMMCNMLEHSLSSWSRNIFRFTGHFLSKQALDKRLRSTSCGFAKRLLGQVLNQKLKSQLDAPRFSRLFHFFQNVYLEDSTCISLPNNLAEHFPGPHNRYGKSATARIQLLVNLLRDTFTKIELHSYRDNDAKYAKQILDIIQQGDLLIRDLGYWSLKVFKAIIDKGAYFLSRYRFGITVLSPEGKQINLCKLLKSSKANGQTVVDMPVLLGKTDKIPVRLVAIKAPQKTVQRRKRKAKKNRDRRSNHSKAYYQLLEWTIIITNIDRSVWTYKQILKAYGFRWRIEMIFKCWKSKFKLEMIFKSHQSLNANRAKTTMYLLLLMLSLFHARWYAYFTKAVYKYCGKEVSPFKFADFVKEHFWDLIGSHRKLKRFVPIVAYYCAYEQRKRKSHLELLFNPLS